MPKKDDVVRLRHMLDGAKKALKFTEGKSRSDLDQDEKLALALVRLIEIVGEAAAKVSSDIQASHQAVPWKEIVSTRNRLIHGYEDVDLNIIWKIIEADLPVLVRELYDILKHEEGMDQRAPYS